MSTIREAGCGAYAEDLFALAWGKLDDDADGVRRHVESCAACREELAQLELLASETDRAGRVEPSPDFHSRLMDRIRSARAVPASGAASRRLAKFEERYRVRLFRPYRKLFAISTSIATAATVIFALSLWKLQTPAQPEREVVFVQPEGQVVMARWLKRSDSDSITLKDIDGTTVDLSDVLADEELFVTGYVDMSRHERCLMAFRAADWHEFTASVHLAPPGTERMRMESIVASGRKVRSERGRLTIPVEMYERFIGDEKQVMVIGLDGRAEIWPREVFERYRRIVPEIIVPTERFGDLG